MDDIQKNSKILDRWEENKNNYDSLESGGPNKKSKKITTSLDNNTSKDSFERGVPK